MTGTDWAAQSVSKETLMPLPWMLAVQQHIMGQIHEQPTGNRSGYSGISSPRKAPFPPHQ